MNDNTSSLWNDEDWKREFTDIFFARRRIIFLTAILIFCVAVLIAFLMPPTYKATASVLVRGKKPQINPGLLEDAEIRTQDISEEDVVSELQILASPELIRRTLSNLYGVDAKAEDTEVGGKLPMIETGELADAVSHVKANLETEVVPSSNVIRISYYEKDEALAEEILDGLLSEYVSYRTEVFSPTAEAAFLKDRAQHYLEQLHAIEGKILDLTRNGNVALIKQEMDNNSMLKKELSHRLAQAEMEYKQQWKKLEPLEKSLEGDGIQFLLFSAMSP